MIKLINGSFAFAVFLILAFCSCAGWAPTPRATARYVESTKLRNCLQNNGCKYPQFCKDESNKRCEEAGLEHGCGIDDLWSRPLSCDGWFGR